MKRIILVAPPLAPAALAELKDWLGIAATTTTEDAGLAALLRAALASCEAFTGVLPIACPCEEILPPAAEWQALAARPVLAITGVQAVPVAGPRTDLDAADYAIDLSADGGGRVRILRPAVATRFAVRFSAGLAADWASLPDGLRQGVVRLAGHVYRQRDAPGETAASPPLAVAALWRPWRGVRLL